MQAASRGHGGSVDGPKQRVERWLYRGGRPRALARRLNRAWAVAYAAGVWPSRLGTLEVRGRRTGRVISFPVVIADLDGRRYLVAMLGEGSNWVANVRAAGGHAVLRHGRRESVQLVEVDAAARGPILRRYLDCAPGARSHVPVDRRADAAEIARIATTIPVFRITSDCSESSRPRMRAAVQTKYGPPEVVRVIDIDTPAPAETELLVRVRATTVNRTDCGFRAAHPFFIRLFTGLLRPRRTVLGSEFAGEVEAVGSAVTAFAIGDRVFGYSGDAFGAHAQHLTIPQHGPVALMPAGSTFEEVAPSTEGSHYALSFIRHASVRAGQDVLVNGATGAIGSAAVQLVKELGANVTAVCAAEHAALVKSLGADRVIDYETVDFAADQHSYDVVLDAVGKSSFGRCRGLLKAHGIYLSSDLGPLSQNPILALITPLLRGKRVMFPVPKHDQAMVLYLKQLIECGTFKPVIDRQYELSEIVDAYRYVETGQKIGNVVITID